MMLTPLLKHGIAERSGNYFKFSFFHTSTLFTSRLVYITLGPFNRKLVYSIILLNRRILFDKSNFPFIRDILLFLFDVNVFTIYKFLQFIRIIIEITQNVQYVEICNAIVSYSQ